MRCRDKAGCNRRMAEDRKAADGEEPSSQITNLGFVRSGTGKPARKMASRKLSNRDLRVSRLGLDPWVGCRGQRLHQLGNLPHVLRLLLDVQSASGDPSQSLRNCVCIVRSRRRTWYVLRSLHFLLRGRLLVERIKKYAIESTFTDQISSGSR